jgi:hypothetical protein
MHDLSLLNANLALIEKGRLCVTLPESWPVADSRVEKTNAIKGHGLGSRG